MELYSGIVFVQKRAYFGNRYWKENRLILTPSNELAWIGPNCTKGHCQLHSAYRSIHLKFSPSTCVEVERSDKSSDTRDQVRLCDYSMVIPMDDEEGKAMRMEFAFGSVEDLCKWLRIFVTVLGGREWISQLIPQSDIKWKIDSAVGYVSPYDSSWPDYMEKWPWLWHMFRLGFNLDNENACPVSKAFSSDSIESVSNTVQVERVQITSSVSKCSKKEAKASRKMKHG